MIVYRISENIDKERPCFVCLENAEFRIRHILRSRGEDRDIVEGEDWTAELKTSKEIEEAERLVFEAIGVLGNMFMEDSDCPSDYEFLEAPLKDAYCMLGEWLDDE